MMCTGNPDQEETLRPIRTSMTTLPVFCAWAFGWASLLALMKASLLIGPFPQESKLGMSKKSRARRGSFDSVEEREAVLFGHVAELLAKDQAPPGVEELLQRHEAMLFLDTRLRENPRNAMAHRLMAPLARTALAVKAMVKHYMCAITYNPMDLDSMVDLADVLYKAGGVEQALEMLQRVLEITSDHFLANKNIGALYARRGELPMALRHTERAAQLCPTDAMVHRNLAKLRHAMGNTQDAVRHNRVAVRLGPGMQGVAEKGDRQAYRNLALQLIATGQRESGFAQGHYDAYRALAGKQNVLSLSERTRELLEKTRTKA